MRKDQIFVLLLVVMLPMSGCFDDAVGEAEGAENDSTDNSSTTTVRNIVKTLHIPDGQTHVITLNGSTTLQIVDIYGVDGDGNWESSTNVNLKMDCDNGISMVTYVYAGGNLDDTYLPVLPNMQCILEFNYVEQSENYYPPREKIIVFQEAELLPP